MKTLLYKTILSFFLFFPIVTHSQTTNDTLIAYQNFIKGDSLSNKGDYGKAINTFKIASKIYQEQKIWSRYAQCLNEISYNFYRLDKLDEAQENANLSLKICRSKLHLNSLHEASALSHIAKVYRKKNKHNDALYLYKKALNITKHKVGVNHIKTADLYTNIGILYDDNFGYVEEAYKHYLKSLEINQKLYNSKKNNDLNGVYLNLAILYSRNGLYHQAQPYYEKAIKLNKAVYGENHPYIAEDYYNFASNFSFIGENYLALQYFKKGLNIMKSTYSDSDAPLGIFYEGIGNQNRRLGKLDLALKNYQKALKIYTESYGENDFSTANILSNIAYGVFLQKEDYKSALEYYNKSYNIRKRIFGDQHRNTYKLNQDFGELFEKQGLYDQALSYYTKYLNFAIKNFGNKNQKTAECSIDKARIHLKKRNYLIAAKEYQNAIIASTNNFEDVSIYSNPSSEDFVNPSTLLDATYGKAKALYFLGKEDNNKKTLLSAFSTFKVCDSLIDQTRNSYLFIEDKSNLGNNKSSIIYKDAINNALALFRFTDDSKYLFDAFYFSEKNRARLLEEQLKKIKAKKFANIPQDKLEIIEEFNSKLSFYKSKVYQIQNSKEQTVNPAINRYSDLIFAYTKKIDSSLNLLEKKYPKYHQLKYDNSIISVQTIQKELNPNSMFLEYFVSDDLIYAFSVTKENFWVDEIKIKDLKSKVSNFREAILYKDIYTFKKIGIELYQKLIAHIHTRANFENIVIAPDGALWNINFDLLLTKDTDSYNPKKLPYLLKKQSISYANSANLFFQKRQQNKNILRECLAFSFSDTISGTETIISKSPLSSSKNLPGAKEEIEAISKIVDGAYYYGKEATELNFKNMAHKYMILHLALHGELDDKNPENSKLFFSPIKDSIQDNYLYNHELYSLEIPAELAVLSACNTGTGKISKGEGIMSLGRAFQYAGTNSLILTNWNVLDETTPELMKYFYVNLNQGMTKAKALQQAKIKYLNNANAFRSAPLYWGGFYLIGDPSIIDFKAERKYSFLLLLAVLIIFLIVLLFIRRRHVLEKTL